MLDTLALRAKVNLLPVPSELLKLCKISHHILRITIKILQLVV